MPMIGFIMKIVYLNSVTLNICLTATLFTSFEKYVFFKSSEYYIDIILIEFDLI